MNEAAERMRGKGLPGLTQKFTIKGPVDYDFYLKLAWCPSLGIRITKVNGELRPKRFDGRLDYVDITVGTAQEHNIRALVELVCKEAYALLRVGAWGTDKLIREWRGYPFEPAGYCPQVQGIVKSPIDAAARLIERKRRRWERA